RRSSDLGTLHGSVGAGAHRGPQGLIQVGLQVFDGFDAHGQADQIVGHAGSQPLLLAQLAVGSGSRVDDQGLGVTHVGQVGPDADVVDQAAAGLDPALDAEDHHGAESVGQVLLGQVV